MLYKQDRSDGPTDGFIGKLRFHSNNTAGRV